MNANVQNRCDSGSGAGALRSLVLEGGKVQPELQIIRPRAHGRVELARAPQQEHLMALARLGGRLRCLAAGAAGAGPRGRRPAAFPTLAYPTLALRQRDERRRRQREPAGPRAVARALSWPCL